MALFHMKARICFKYFVNDGVLFNIYLNMFSIFLIDKHICNFADDTTPFVCDEAFGSAVNKWKINSELAIWWFENNCMKLNTDKWNLLVSGTKY